MAFKKGVSGNLNGRPRLDAKVSRCREKIIKALPEIVDALIIQAKDGDQQAIKILIDRVMPSLKARSETIMFDVPAGSDAATLSLAIVNKMANGEVAPDDANQAMSALSSQCKIYDIVELTKKVDELLERTK